MMVPVLVLVPMLASGLGLGEITIESYLNQPLRATIAINSRDGEDLSGLEVSEAPSADYQRLGLTYSRAAIPLEFQVVQSSSGPQVRVTSELPVKDPVLQIAAEARWSKGRLLRPYTVFLDPATTDAASAPARRPEPVQAEEPDSNQAESSATVSVNQAQPSSSSPSQDSAPTAQTPAMDASRFESGRFGPVRSGETLWSIASTARGNSGVSVNRYMLAIQRLNPEAFNNGNINSLKRGAILRLPEATDIEGIGDREATTEVIAQEQAWREGIPAPASNVAADSETTPVLDPAGRIASDDESADTDSVADNEPPDAVAESENDFVADADSPQTVDEVDGPAGELRLVPPADDELLDESDLSEQGDNQLRERLARTEEDLINANAEKAVLEDRLNEFEGASQPGDAERESDQAVGVQDQALADLQEEIRRQRQQDAQSQSDRTAEPEAGAQSEASEAQPEAATEPRRQRRGQDTPFWKSPWLWLAGLLGLLIAGFLWMRGRSQGADDGSSGSFMDRMFEQEDSKAGSSDNGSEDDDSVEALQQDAEELLRELDEDREAMQDEVFGADDGAGEDELDSDGPVERQEGAATVAALSDDELEDSASDDSEVVVEEADLPASAAVDAEIEGSDVSGEQDSDQHPGSMDVDEDWAHELDDSSEPDAEAQESADVDDPFAASLEGDEASEDSGFSDDDVPEGEDSMEVKLDLARAYVGMDDREAAEAILEEVIADGNEDQQSEARRMLENL